ncbi:MAG: Fe-S oxidoreductase, partial [Steroidobacteraceae bacterium]
MSEQASGPREGSLEAPTRHPIDWKGVEFWDEQALFKELERAFDICHGCRRCVSLCNAFPVLFDKVDESSTGEVDGVAHEAYWEVVDHCYLCDMCYLSKCPYVPPPPGDLAVPPQMLRAKAVRFKKQGASFRDRVLSSTDLVGSLAGIPVVAEVVNAANRSATGRRVLEATLGVHRNAPVPSYHSDTFQKRQARHRAPDAQPVATAETSGKVAL